MALDSYSALQTAVLDWLARPGDALVAPFVPDMIVLAESELRRRLRVGEAEARAFQVVNTAAVALPAECRQIRLLTVDSGDEVQYVPPPELPGGSGPRYKYTLFGAELRLGPAPSGNLTLDMIYQTGLPPLSDAEPTNWLLAAHPDAYLYSTLIAAEAFIGHDERIALWTQAAAQAIASIEAADRKARWPGGLQIRVDGITATRSTSPAWVAEPVTLAMAGWTRR
jgi:hypothetical protein